MEVTPFMEIGQFMRFFFTFPVTFISFMYRFAESGSLIPVYIIQFFMFILTFGILSIFIRK